MQQHITGASFSLSSPSPSLTAYSSSENIADIAARVVKELNLSHDDPYHDDFYSNAAFQDPHLHQNDDLEEEEDDDNDDNDDDEESEFEFAILNSSPISADEIFSNGQIKPMFPVFNTDLVYGYNYNDAVDGDVSVSPSKTMRLPLRKLLEDRETRTLSTSSSSSSSEAVAADDDELEGIPPGTYCVWTPKKKEEVLQMKKKSKSTGFPSKRWRFKDLLHRSNSDGKDTFVFFTPANHHKGGAGKRREKTMVRKGGVDNGNGNGGKKKSYLPYRQDLVGFFANVNGISRTVRPF